MRRAAAPNALDTSGFLAPLVYPDYCLLWGATACGQAAAWALVVLRAALVYELTRSNAAIVHADGSLPLCAHHGLSDVVLSVQIVIWPMPSIISAGKPRWATNTTRLLPGGLVERFVSS
jgi:hypothetical protein